MIEKVDNITRSIKARTDLRPDQTQTSAQDAIRLSVNTGPDSGCVLLLKQFPIKIGRGGSSGLVVAAADDPPTVSREHATLSLIESQLIITDHSRNGTRVGSAILRAGESADLDPGSSLCLGAALQLTRPMMPLSEAETRVTMLPRRPDAVNANMKHNPLHKVKPAAVVRPVDLRTFLLSPQTLQEAWKRVALNRGGAGIDGITIAQFEAEADQRLLVLHDLLRTGRYEPMPPRLFAAPKRGGGARRIAILCIQDRIVQNALNAAYEPLLDPTFPPCSYAYRQGGGTQAALRKADSLFRTGLAWAVRTDIADFFDSIPHSILLDKLAGLVNDPFSLSLLAKCFARFAPVEGRGLAQGAATSPLLSNLYLAEFDNHLLKLGWSPIRYADDLLIPCSSRNSCECALAEAEGYLRSRLQLSLRQDKTAMVPVSIGFTFLGFRFGEDGRRPAVEAVDGLNRKLGSAISSNQENITRGWSSYFGSPANVTEEKNSCKQKADQRLNWSGNSYPLKEPDAEWTDRFLKLFAGREGVYARESASRTGCRRFTPCTGAITAEMVRRHVRGEETLAAYLLATSGLLSSLVLDIDLVSDDTCEESPCQEISARERLPVLSFVQDLRRVCSQFGVPVQLEDSGRRGRHIWLFFSRPVEPDNARMLARLLAGRAGYPREGVRLEILPRQTVWPGAELGDAVKLPFGVHPVTGNRCHLLDEEGEPIVDINKALGSIRSMDASAVDDIITHLTEGNRAERGTCEGAPTIRRPGRPTNKDNTGRVGQLLQGCSVVRGLVQRAKQTGHLRHTHNLILLYTAGRLGEPGSAFLHNTISLCRNYNQKSCQSYIDKLSSDHPVITCRRIREWLEEEGETALCSRCRETNPRSPLDHIHATTSTSEQVNGAKPSSAAAGQKASADCLPQPEMPGSTQIMAESAWLAVAADLFGDGPMVGDDLYSVESHPGEISNLNE